MSIPHSAILKITVSPDGLEQTQIASLLLRGGILPTEPSLSAETSASRNKIYGWNLHWRAGMKDPNPPR